MSRQLERGVVGYWCPMLATTGLRLYDRSGKGNRGTLTNMAPASDWVTSKVRNTAGRVLDFDGVDDRVDCGPIQSFSGDCSWSCWFRHTAIGSDQCLMTTRNILTGASRNGIAIYLRGAGLATLDAEFVVAGSRFTASASVNTATGVWYLAVGRRVGGTCFVDVPGLGSATSAGSSTATITHEVGVTIGMWRDYAVDAFSVRIAEACVWNRGITPSETRELYRLGPGWFGKRESMFPGYAEQAAGFKAYWARRQSQLIGGGL